MHDAAHDPGGATPSRLAMAHMLPSLDATGSASATLNLSGLNTNLLDLGETHLMDLCFL
jgi:hypothetical protein